MSYSYDRTAARIPPSLGHRSGYELRVIGFLSDVWPFQVQHGKGNDEADMLEVAARGVDTMKRKHPDLWKGMVEVNLAPKDVADIIVSVALKESGFKNGSAKKVPVSQRSPLEQASYWARSAYSALRAGMPESARENLEKAEAVIERDPELKRTPGLQAKLRESFRALASFDPRSADRLVESVMSLLKAR